jgi:uroporphyrinogen decarboxylase
MNALERVSTVLQGKIPDRVPIFGNLLEQGAKELGMSIEEYYSKGEYVAEGQLRMRERYGYDNLSGFFFAGKSVEMLGCQKIIYSESGPPNVGHFVIQEDKDIEDLEIPADLTQAPGFADVADCIRILRSEAGGEFPIGGSVISTFSLPALLMGIDRWLTLFINGPRSLCRELLEKCSEFCIREIQALRDAGVDMVSYSNPVGSADFITRSQFKDLALEWIIRDIDAVGSEGITYFNGGGRINPMLDLIIENTGIGAYYINPRDDVAEAKAIIGNRGVSSGVINDIRLHDWSPEEIDREVQRIMAAGAEGGRFFFGTLVMPYLLPEENIEALFRSAFRHSEYPRDT